MRRSDTENILLVSGILVNLGSSSYRTLARGGNIISIRPTAMGMEVVPMLKESRASASPGMIVPRTTPRPIARNIQMVRNLLRNDSLAGCSVNGPTLWEDIVQNILKYFALISECMTYRVLFICTHNSARSQMAEGIANALFSGRVEARSAGTRPGTVHPLAIEAMAEMGIDISGNRSKHLDEFKDTKFDLAITVCDGANETCPFFSGAREHEHAGFPDPSGVEGTRDEQLAAFRDTREAIIRYLQTRFHDL